MHSVGMTRVAIELPRVIGKSEEVQVDDLIDTLRSVARSLGRYDRARQGLASEK